MIYRIATPNDLEIIWNKDIKRHPNDDRWKAWKPKYIGYNTDGLATTFVAVLNEEPVGQITLIMSPTCTPVINQPVLCDGKTTFNFNAFRIDKKYEGQGHISKLVKMAENYAKEKGATTLTIGVEINETRNREIYSHWGFTTKIFEEFVDGETVLYFSKQL